MTAPMTADLETGAVDTTLTTDPQEHSLSSLIDTAIESDDTPDTAPEPVPDTKADRGDGRTVEGKFAPKPKDEAAPPDPAKPPAATQQTEQPPTAPTKAPTKAPFRYRALGKTNDVEGSEITDDGKIVFPQSSHSRLAQAFNALEVMNGQFGPLLEQRNARIAELEREVEASKGTVSATDAQASKLVEYFTGIANEPDDEKALNMMWQLRQNFPALLAKAEADHWRGQAERQNKPAQPAQPAAPVAPAGPSMPSAADVKAHAVETIEHWKITPEFRAFGPETWKHVEAKVNAQPFAFLRPATAEDAQRHTGVREGALVFDTDLLYAEFQGHHERESAARETAAKQAELKAKNAVRTQTTITAPPTAGGTQPPPTRAKSPQQGQSLDELIDNALEDD